MPQILHVPGSALTSFGCIGQMKPLVLVGRSLISGRPVPGILSWGEFSDVAGLIAPRHQLIVNGRQDPLFPLAEVVTPNIFEAERLVGHAIGSVTEMQTAAEEILALGTRKVVVKGGHLGDAQATDVLYDGQTFRELGAPRWDTPNTHGTGCTFSSAIAANLALGDSFFEAVAKAKTYISGAIRNALPIGRGHGPTHHFFDLYARAGLAQGAPGPAPTAPRDPKEFP